MLADLLEYEQQEPQGTLGSEPDVGAEFYTMACPSHLEGTRQS